MKKYSTLLILMAFLMMFTSCNAQNKKEVMADENKDRESAIKLFLCGDVMTGRGIDQALPHPVDPALYESYVRDARDYLHMAERANGNIETPVSYDYIWGDALKVWKENNADLKLINLETSVTTYAKPLPGKGIHYRMHPKNTKVLEAAGIDHCSLANNHILDWSHPGLLETTKSLAEAGIAFSGVGKNKEEAARPSILNTEKGRVLVYSFGSPDSGIPPEWEAEENQPGINYLKRLDQEHLNRIKNQVREDKKDKDLAVLSVHWGGNWGYDIPKQHRDFAHRLIDETKIDIVFGHSSHHPMGVEVYKEKLIIYGAGDFINDYEGIGGHGQYRGELILMYFPVVDIASGKLQSLKLVPMKLKNLQLHHVADVDAKWLEIMLDREGEKLGTGVRREADNSLWLEW